MAENLIDLRRRIKATKNNQKTTRAMKTVSAAKLRRSVMELNKTKPVMEKISALLKRVGPSVDAESLPLLTERETGKTLMVVISADRGLCGAFNSHLISAADNHYNEHLNKSGDNLSLVTVGNKVSNYFIKRKAPIKKNYKSVMSRLKSHHALDLSKYLQGIYLDADENIKKIEFIYTEYISASKREIRIKQLFPIKSEWLEDESDTGNIEDTEYIFEPSEQKIFEYLLPKYIDTGVRQILFQSATAEHMARMTAMEQATQNANDMIRTLTLTMNKLRQASITKELLEIITATEALRK